MDQNLIVISKSAEIRDSFAESYTLLGYEVSVCEDIFEVIRDLNLFDPDYVIMDIDELARKWKIAAAGLRLAQKKITVILLSSAMTLEEANEALILGVSGVIIKPFLPEFHLKRVYDIIHRKMKAEGKRIYPRFYTGDVFDGILILQSDATNRFHTFELVNISEIGAAARMRDPTGAPEIEANYVVYKALLRLDNEEFSMSIQVVFRKGGLIGVNFQDISQGESNFTRFIQKLSLKAFGISGLQGKW